MPAGEVEHHARGPLGEVHGQRDDHRGVEQGGVGDAGEHDVADERPDRGGRVPVTRRVRRPWAAVTSRVTAVTSSGAARSSASSATRTTGAPRESTARARASGVTSSGTAVPAAHNAATSAARTEGPREGRPAAASRAGDPDDEPSTLVLAPGPLRGQERTAEPRCRTDHAHRVDPVEAVEQSCAHDRALGHTGPRRRRRSDRPLPAVDHGRRHTGRHRARYLPGDPRSAHPDGWCACRQAGRGTRSTGADARPPAGGCSRTRVASGSGRTAPVAASSARTSTRSSSVARGRPGHTCFPIP